MFGGGGGQSYEASADSPAAQEGYDEQADPCLTMMRSFQQCLQQVEGEDSMASCKWPLDQLRECRHNNGQTPGALVQRPLVSRAYSDGPGAVSQSSKLNGSGFGCCRCACDGSIQQLCLTFLFLHSRLLT